MESQSYRQLQPQGWLAAGHPAISSGAAMHPRPVGLRVGIPAQRNPVCLVTFPPERKVRGFGGRKVERESNKSTVRWPGLEPSPEVSLFS